MKQKQILMNVYVLNIKRSVKDTTQFKNMLLSNEIQMAVFIISK